MIHVSTCGVAILLHGVAFEPAQLEFLHLEGCGAMGGIGCRPCVEHVAGIVYLGKVVIGLQWRRQKKRCEKWSRRFQTTRTGRTFNTQSTFGNASNAGGVRPTRRSSSIRTRLKPGLASVLGYPNLIEQARSAARSLRKFPLNLF